MVVRGRAGEGERVGEPPIVVRGRPSGDTSRESSALCRTLARCVARRAPADDDGGLADALAEPTAAAHDHGFSGWLVESSA